MSTASLETAIDSTRSVLAGVSADQMSDPTPCAKWDVRHLTNHVIAALGFFTAGISGEAPADGDVDFTQGDMMAAYDAAAAKCVAAFQADGALEATHKLPFGDLPGFAFMGIATTDMFTHGWDLAKATGQDVDLAPELAASLLEQSKASLKPEFRSEDGAVFGMEQQASEGATAADQLAAFLGRIT